MHQQGREDRLGQLWMAEEVRPELVGSQESPSRVMARCKMALGDNSDKTVCGTIGETCGVITGAPRRA